MILDHIGFGVGDYETSKAFYSAALAPLGCKLIGDEPQPLNPQFRSASFGEEWAEARFFIGSEGRTSPPVHIAFRAESRAAVDAFYAAAMAAGGRDNGPPGLRPHYQPTYYAAFVLDPDGHNIEAVCLKPE
jgi:catechol 2,3-dioxygenase-like lactoylglutathione lyase family enzyme